MTRTAGRAAIIASMLIGSWAHALSPRIPEVGLCAKSHIFVGKVVDVKSTDCRLAWNGPCGPRDRLEMHIEVGQVYRTAAFPEWVITEPGRSRHVVRGERLYAFTNGFGMRFSRDAQPLMEQDVPDPMTTEWIRNWLVGKSLIFAMPQYQGGNFVETSTGPVSALYGTTHPLDAAQWVEKTLATHCR